MIRNPRRCHSWNTWKSGRFRFLLRGLFGFLLGALLRFLRGLGFLRGSLAGIEIDELDDRDLAAVAEAPAQLHHTGISSRPVPDLRGDLAEQLLYHLTVLDEPGNLPAR